MPIESGQKLAHYRLIEEIGVGGTGVIWKAEDTTLGRHVALKVLHESHTADADSLERLENEARAIAALNHPGIVTVYSVEKAAGLRFLTMELVRGRPLSELIDFHGMDLEPLFDLGLQIVEAVSAAHEQGIIHRDLKPQNILVDDLGHPKILDFGLAKLREEAQPSDTSDLATASMTREERVVGTLPYMSPEQVKGLAPDHRTDIFSLGVVLYEMATGQRPFAGATRAELVSTILRDTPRPVTDIRNELPGQLGWILGQCLEKNRERRLQLARDLRNQLDQLRREVERGEPGPVRSVAVLPFADMSREKDQDFFCEGLAEEIISALARIKDLRVAARTSSFRFKSQADDAREIGRQLGVDTLLEGSVRTAGSRVRVTAQLVNVADGYHLWSQRYDRDLDDIFAIQDDMSSRVVEALQITLGPQDQPLFKREKAPDVKAYEFYLRGRQFLHRVGKRSFEVARQMFSRAVEIDPAYAKAHAGLANCCSLMHEYEHKSRHLIDEALAASARALDLDPGSAEAHAARGMALSKSRQYEQADEHFESAALLNPALFEAHYYHAYSRYIRQDWQKAEELFKKASAVLPEDYQSHVLRGVILQKLDRRDEARSCFETAVGIIRTHVIGCPDDVRAFYFGAGCLAELGNQDEALEWLERARVLEPDDPAFTYSAACVYVRCARPEQAIDCLEEGIRKGASYGEWIAIDPDFDSIRDHPRFRALLKQQQEGR